MKHKYSALYEIKLKKKGFQERSASTAWINYLLSTVTWQVKHQHREKWYPHARYYEINGVEQSLPSHGDVESDVEVRLVATRVKLFVSAIRTFARFALTIDIIH